MTDLHIRREGRAGRITLDRGHALNALSYEMCLAIDAALRDWAENDAVALVLVDATGDKAFCAGGDLGEMYATGRAGDAGYGRRFWADEYRMNARIAEYPKPIVTLMQGYTLGGGVGLGCHASHRVVCDTSRIAMPECAVGIVPDVGGSRLLARAPGRAGAYLGLTGARMGPGCAIWAGFADHFVPRADWAALVAELVATGDVRAIPDQSAPDSPLATRAAQIDRLFQGATGAEIVTALQTDRSSFATEALEMLARGSPLAQACALEVLARLGPAPGIRNALAMEYRFTWRATEQSDFLEGIRAAIIDKDRTPHWRHSSLAEVSAAEVEAMLASLGAAEMTFETEGERP
ncbi:enoyl-CoA hydratase/isomerase family protein [Roseibaca sp. Y0-43]|uniref:enoyl-CoA hydratase/isomerase family protein n=1 Tax=Roseibaca sp. Y0-43 TaxID=2816854 RepID=UPI001D0C7D6D|nr:enoyl-CoA hydratase/isomerase family protein [Roseibaca sp. Y0-43]MCC1482376.1 enoyl-CoA hydratase/isomerase family protein [Roseibaca sp. Y0-43]